MKQTNPMQEQTLVESSTNLSENQTLVQRLRIRASIRRSIPSRKSVQEGKPDRIADLLEEAADGFEYIQGCFHAAEIEGLHEALAETTDERLKDLIERRLMYAYYFVQYGSKGT